MQFNQITNETYQTENIIFGNVAQKTVPNVNPPSVYNEIALEYNYGDANCQIRAPLHWELPEVTTSSGITESEMSGRKKFSIPITLSTANNADHEKCVKIMDSIYKSCAENIFKNKAALKLPKFLLNDPEACGFKHPIYYPRDKVTLEIVPGKSPSLYLTLSIRKDSRTVFCGLDEKPIAWDLLKNVQMSFVPLIQFEKIYVGGGKPSLQMKLVSAIVTSVISKSSVIRQKSTIERLRQNNPNLVDNVSKQLEVLKSSGSETSDSSSTNQGKQEYGSDEDVSSPVVETQAENSPPRLKSKLSMSTKPGATSRLQDFLKQ
jgi:hypothetical protein